MVEMEARPAHHRCRADVCAARARQALVVLFGLYIRGVDHGRGWRAAGAGRQGLFRLHRRGAAADRSLRPPQHDRKIRPGARGGARARSGPGAGSRLRGPATLAAAQIRRGDAVSPHQPAALGQASARGRPAGNAGADAETRRNRGGSVFKRKPAPHLMRDGHRFGLKKRVKIRSPGRRPLTPTGGIPICPPPYYNPLINPRGRSSMPNDTRQLPAAHDALYRFLGGSPLTVAFRLILLSILVGVVLAAIGFDPWNILNSIQLLFRRLWDLGFDAINWLWRYFLLGAVIVIPVWLLSRMFGASRPR